MDQETGRLYFDVLLNDESLQQGLQRSRESFRSLGETANAELQSMDGFMAKAAQTAAGLFAADKLKDFASAIATVRGEYQQLEIAFETMLGSKSQADALMAQLIDTAATTPFEMKEIAESSKMLLAYGMAADEVNGTLIRLGDIAAGLSIPIKDLAFLYGTTMVQGRLYTQDLNQFLGRGIPLADELAKQFGKNKSEVKKLVEEGKIGFPEVQKAIEALTNEGSKFGGLMEAQSKTIKGQLSNIEDAWEQMINEIGRSQEENISGALDITGKLIENWRTVGKVVLTAAAAIGSYKAAVVTLAAIRKVSDTATVLNTGQHLRSVLTLEQQAKLSKMKLSTSSLAYAKAVQTEVHAELQKQKALVQTTQIEVQAAEKEIAFATMREKKAAEAVAAKRSQVGAAMMSGNAKRLEAATTALSTAQERLNTAEKAKNTAIQSLSSKQATLNTAAKRVNTLETAANTAAQTASTGATNLLSMAFHGLGKAIMSNPIGLIVGAITAAASAMFFFTKSTNETTEMSERFGESAAKSIQQVDMLGTALMGLDEGTGVYKKTMDELNTILEEYGITQIKEGDNIDSINEKRKQAIELIKEEGVERQRLNAIQTANDEYEKSIEEKRKEVASIFKKVDVAYSGKGENFRMDDSGWMKRHAETLSTIYIELLRKNVGKGKEEIDRLFRAHLAEMKKKGKEVPDAIISGRWESRWGYNASNALKEQSEAINELNEGRKNSIELINASAKAAKEEGEAHMTSAERIEAGARKILNASKTADELYKNVSKIVKDFSDNTLNFHINVDGEIPQWMLNMDLEALKQNGAKFVSAAEEARRSGKKEFYVSGKAFKTEEGLQHGVTLTRAAQEKEARQEAARKKAEEDRKQAAKDAKAEAKRRAKAAADARKKAEEERKRIALEKHDLEKDIEKYKDSVIEKEYESSLEIRQNKINLLEDGYEKERQQIELNYERLLYENKKRSDAMVEAIKENKMREWKIANPKATKEKENAYRDKLNVTEKDFEPSQRLMLAQYQDIADKTKVKAMQDLYTRSIEGFQDYDTRRAKIAEEGAKKREEIERTHADYIKALNEEVTKAKAEKQAALDKFDAEAHTAAEQREKEALAKLEQIGDSKDRALAESKQKQEKDIKAVNDEEIERLQKTSALFVKLFGDASEKSRKELRGVITETENLLSYLRSTDDKDLAASFGFSEKQLHNLKQSPEKLKDITEQLKRLKDAAKDGNPFGELADAINDVFKKAEKGENLKSLEVRLKRLGTSTAEAADEIGKVAAKLSALFEAAGSQNMAEQAEGLMNAMSTVSNIGKGFAQGGIVGAIEAGAMEVLGYVTKAFQAAAVHKKALLDIQKQINDQQLQYNELLRVEQREARDLETIFGSDKLTKARRSLLLAKDWEDDIKRSIKGDYNALAKHRWELYVDDKLKMGSDRTILDAKAEGYNYGLGMFSVKTGHAKSGFFGLGKGRDLYSGLTQIAEYKDLVKANGHLNLELAKSIAATREFEGDGKKAFEALIKKEEDFEAALKQMDDYLGGLFGNYASDIMDAVVDAFERGTDAAEAFGDVTKKVMRNVAKDMVQAAVLQPVIQKQSELVKQAFASGNREEYIKALGEASRAFADVQKVAQEEYKNMADIFKKNGNDLTADSTTSREASQKGIATASQDSVDELNGRMTAVQGHTFDIAENTRMLLATTNEILKGVVGIERNTGNVHTRLSVVEQHLKSVKDTVGDIALKGIKIKQ